MGQRHRFTDLVKRPTASSGELKAAAIRHGRELLRAKLLAARPRLLLFAYKRPAVELFGRFAGVGYRPELQLAGTRVWVMPGGWGVTNAERQDAIRQLREVAGEL